MKNLTDFRKTVETGVDPRLNLKYAINGTGKEMVRPTQTVTKYKTTISQQSPVSHQSKARKLLGFGQNARASIRKNTENFFGLFVQNIC